MRRGSASFHRQGHHQLPLPVLASNAVRGRLPDLRAKVHTHGLITVDGVQMSKLTGHVHQCQHLSRTPRSRVPALLLQMRQRSPPRDHFDVRQSNVRRSSIAAGERRPRRQGGQTSPPVVPASSHRGFGSSKLAESIGRREPVDATVSEARQAARPNSTSGATWVVPCARSPRSRIAPTSTSRTHEPWKHVNDPERRDEVQGVCSLGHQTSSAASSRVSYLKPILVRQWRAQGGGIPKG